MGTRNLTIVMSQGRCRIAQYGQWDGYPTGQGATVLEFCRKHLNTEAKRKAFKEDLKRVRFIGKDEHEALYEKLGIPIGSQWIDLKDAKKFAEAHPALDRDMASKVLDYVRTSSGEVLLQDDLEFAADSLMCEWAYVIDLDTQVLEVYKGFNTAPLPSDARFAHMGSVYTAKGSGSEPSRTYYPVRMVASWKLDDLPNKEAFLKQADVPDEDEEVEALP